MTVRTAMPGTEATGDVWTTTLIDKLPGGWIGYAEVTANQTGIGSSVTDLTSLTVAVTVNASRRLLITASTNVTQQTSASIPVLYIREGSTTLNSRSVNVLTSSVSQLHCFVVLTPTTGSHTYKLSMSTSSNTVDMNASATQPTFICVEDIGPAS